MSTEKPRECCGSPINAYHLDTCTSDQASATRLYREAMAHPIGTVAVVEGRTAVLIGKSDGARRWQWLNGDWTSIPLGSIEVLGRISERAYSSD